MAEIRTFLKRISFRVSVPVLSDSKNEIRPSSSGIVLKIPLKHWKVSIKSFETV
jgi:hypothetical protein